MTYSAMTTDDLLDVVEALIQLKDATPVDSTRAGICDALSEIEAELDTRREVPDWPLYEVIYDDGIGVEAPQPEEDINMWEYYGFTIGSFL